MLDAPCALLVEDEPQIRRFVRAALEQEGWQVHESVSMARGLIDAGTRRPDLIVLDLGLPDGDGRLGPRLSGSDHDQGLLPRVAHDELRRETTAGAAAS